MKMGMNIFKSLLLTTPFGRIVLIGPRIFHGIIASGVIATAIAVFRWGFYSREPRARGYYTHEDNQYELCSVISFVSGRSLADILAYKDEILFDEVLKKYVSSAVRRSREKWSHDDQYKLGRRLAYYLLVRSLRPKFVVEAGVDRGLGALVICRALERNAAEGVVGDYLGIEANNWKDIFLYSMYQDKIGKIVYGDSVNEIKTIDKPIDLFIHETCSESHHVRAQIDAVRNLLSANSVVAVPWPLREFIDFSVDGGWLFLTHKDNPKDHWYGGSRMMFLFRDSQRCFAATGSEDRG